MGSCIFIDIVKSLENGIAPKDNDFDNADKVRTADEGADGVVGKEKSG